VSYKKKAAQNREVPSCFDMHVRKQKNITLEDLGTHTCLLWADQLDMIRVSCELACFA